MPFSISSERIKDGSLPQYWITDYSNPVLTFDWHEQQWLPASDYELYHKKKAKKRTKKDKDKFIKKYEQDPVQDGVWSVAMTKPMGRYMATYRIYKLFKEMKDVSWPIFGHIHMIWNSRRVGRLINFGLLWMNDPFAKFDHRMPKWMSLHDLNENGFIEI